jgi:hypothetical protein
MKFSDTVRSLTKKLADTVSATEAARNDIAEVRARIAELRRQLLEASEWPLPRADVSPRIRDVVQSAGDYWISTYGSSLIHGEAALASPTLLRGDQVQLPDYGKALMTWGAYCAAFPDQACACLEALVAKVQYQAGLPQAERPAVVERLTSELQALETREEAAIDEMNHAGVVIAHRPEVLSSAGSRRRWCTNVTGERWPIEPRARPPSTDGTRRAR